MSRFFIDMIVDDTGQKFTIKLVHDMTDQFLRQLADDYYEFAKDEIALHSVRSVTVDEDSLFEVTRVYDEDGNDYDEIIEILEDNDTFFDNVYEVLAE